MVKDYKGEPAKQSEPAQVAVETQASDPDAAPRFIRGAALRKRWGGMSNSTFYEKRRKGLIPKPVYLFGPEVPYWIIAEIEELERQAVSAGQA